MKYGLLYFKDTNNIGDDIQAYAASRFLPKIDYMIDREKLNSFVPDKEEYVATIMNAWYIHDKFNFGISPYIYPLLISMFFKRFPYESGITVGIDYLNENVKSILKKYGPVGTRDKHTLKVMNELDIDAYFSGCMTLTLDKFDSVEKDDYIVVVGLRKEEIEFLKTKTKRKIVEFIQDVELGSFSDESWDERKTRVEETLKLYQGAHMVITNKLHCSLPCLALETPVLLLYDTSFSENKDRIGTYLSYLNHIKREELYTADFDLENPKSNPKKYLELREHLIQKCTEFIKESSKIKSKDLPLVKTYSELINKSNIEKKVIIKHLDKLCETYEFECLKSSKLHDEINNLTDLNNKLKNDNENLESELSSIVNSKGWKFLEKLRKLK